jgi:hypothetical protein
MKQHSLHHAVSSCEVKLKIIMETHELLGRLPVWRNKLCKNSDFLGIRWSLLLIDCFVRIDQTNTDHALFCTATCHIGEPSY